MYPFQYVTVCDSQDEIYLEQFYTGGYLSGLEFRLFCFFFFLFFFSIISSGPTPLTVHFRRNDLNIKVWPGVKVVFCVYTVLFITVWLSELETDIGNNFFLSLGATHLSNVNEQLGCDLYCLR